MKRCPLRWLPCVLLGLTALTARAELFRLPTANHALFEPDGGDKFLAGTVGKPWTSGGFGCVRSDGLQMHEGLDIRSLQRDRHGEPTDPVMATADGTVVYLNSRPSLSNYGNYIVLRHLVEGLEIYSVYAHLHEIAPGLKTGQEVKAGQVIAIMGRTANTHEGISKDRAHVHFELNVIVNDHFARWFAKTNPGQRNDHGDWNGQNLNGLDPRRILLEEHEQGTNFSLLKYMRAQTELFRVAVRATDFPWLHRYAPLIVRNPLAEKNGVAGYELALDFNGVPIEMIPRSAAELKGSGKFTLLSVNEAEQHRNSCRNLVVKRGSRWELTNRGSNLVGLIIF